MTKFDLELSQIILLQYLDVSIKPLYQPQTRDALVSSNQSAALMTDFGKTKLIKRN